MAIIKCKMCGGDMEISEDKTFGVCEYCGTSMTLPKVDNEQRAAAFNRGNHFRRIGEFDKALAVYERIVAEDNSDAEAHWCCALCRFGIEYVEDPATYEWLPTCHRASFDNFLEDVDYLAAVEYSDGITRRQYQKDAAKIAEVQRGILATSQKEEPFDVFICYKESDENGQRTVDSTLAQDIYYQLTDKGRRVFFARITLEDKGGAEYEPYIFAALNSAKVMVVVGTSAEHFNAVWVKNEWSRFLSLMKKDHSKLLLPCYRDMDPYDLPDQLSVLQSYDMSKIGFIQDLIRGIDKVLDADKQPEAKQETVVVQGEGGGNISALIKRGNMALEDGDWSKADGFFDRVLDQNAECAEAYLGKALIEAKAANLKVFRGKFLPVLGQISPVKVEVDIPGHEEREEKIAAENVIPGYLEKEELQEVFVFDFCYSSRSDSYEQQMKRSLLNLANDRNLSRAERYASGALKAEIASFKESIKSEMEQTLREAHTKDEQSEKDVREHYEQTFAQWEQQANQMRSDAEARRERDYQKAIVLFEDEKYDQALAQFQMPKLIEYRETANYIEQIKKAKEDKERRRAEEAARLEVLKKKEQAEKKKRAIIISVIIVLILCISLISAMKYNEMALANKYDQAQECLANGEYDVAIALYTELGNYSDAQEKLSKAEEMLANSEIEGQYNQAQQLIINEDYEKAISILTNMDEYEDSDALLTQCIEGISDNIISGGDEDITILSNIPYDYYESHIEACYIYAQALFYEEEWDLAATYFDLCNGHEQADNYGFYSHGRQAMGEKKYEDAVGYFLDVSDFLDADAWLGEATYQFVMTDSSYAISVDDIYDLLSKASNLNDSASELLELCESLMECEGEFSCYEKMKEDGSITTNDTRYFITLTFFFYEGQAYVDIDNTLFHDTTLNAALVEKSDGEYTFEAHCSTSESSKEREHFYFSSSKAKYEGYVFSNTFFYSK